MPIINKNQRHMRQMKLTFGPVHPISIFLYAVGVPLLLVTLVDHINGFLSLSEVLRLQLFLSASICIVVASVLNLSLHIYRQWRSNHKDSC